MATYAETLAKAKAGKLSFEDFLAYWTSASFDETSSQLASHVSAILVQVKRTEPGQEWVKKNWVTVKNGKVGVVSQTVEAYPGQSVLEGANKVGSSLVNAITSPLDFLKVLFSASLWLRVAEVALGLLLVGAGLAKMSQRAAVIVKQVPVAGKVLT